MTRHNFHILYQKFLNQSSFRRKFNSLQLCLSKLKSKNASFERYEPKLYRSLGKSTKRHFFVKAIYTKIKTSNEKVINTKVVGDILRVPKSPRSPSYDKNWESYDWCKLSKIWENAWNLHWTFWAFGPMGLSFKIESCLWHIQGPQSSLWYYFDFDFILFWFYSKK